MAKHLKINIKNTQLAKAVNLDKLKSDLGKGKKPKAKKAQEPPKEEPKEEEEEAPVRKRKIKARSRSAFAPTPEATPSVEEAPPPQEAVEEKVKEEPILEPLPTEAKPEVVAEEAVPAIEKAPPKIEKPEKKAAAPAKAAPAKAAPEAKAAPKGPPRGKKMREFRDVRPKRPGGKRTGPGRDSDDGRWRKRRHGRGGARPSMEEFAPVRPKELQIRLPIAVKDLAASMKLKASQLVQTLFMQGLTLTLNDLLDDETTVQLLGHEFGCEITVDTSEEERIRITDKTIREEILENPPASLKTRAPVVAFMGHVDHGKTSLIDRIRNSQIAAGEAGAITQHIGAFKCMTGHGPITILDTPGHEAFTSMRARGADVTDVVVLVIAGDEGMRPQTLEAIQHARAAGVTIVVAINKCDKPGFDAENVYRQLAEQELLPEPWGGTTIAVSCSAVNGEGIDQLLEMIALQAEVLELKAAPSMRARGNVIESQMHKGMGIIATVLVQNGTLKHGDAVVIDDLWGRIKTMQDEHGKHLTEATPATPVAITGLSDLPMAGKEFIVVDDEKQAREIADARREGRRQLYLQKRKRVSVESLFQEGKEIDKKVLNLILRADVQGSLEALRTSLMKIESEKAELEIIFAGVGAISESDIELASASKAVIIGFHTHVEAHAEDLIKQTQVKVRLHDVIYHAIDDVRDLLAGTLEKVAEEVDKGKADVRATFKSSQVGVIAGCLVTGGSIHRNCRVRQLRGGEVIWKGPIASIKREAEDVREVSQGLECGIVLDGQNDILEGDSFEAFEIIYVTQEL